MNGEHDEESVMSKNRYKEIFKTKVTLSFFKSAADTRKVCEAKGRFKCSCIRKKKEVLKLLLSTFSRLC
jgi:hypothetical protein